MSSSSPLVAVGITTIVFLGTAVPAQSYQAEADAANQTSNNAVEKASSPRSHHRQPSSLRSTNQSASAETIREVNWTHTPPTEPSEEPVAKPRQAVATPLIKLFIGTSESETAVPLTAQVTSEDELQESDGEAPAAPLEEPTEESEPPALPRVDPSNTIDPPGQPETPTPETPTPETLPRDTPSEPEVEPPVAPVAPVDSTDPVDSPDPSLDQPADRLEDREDPAPLPDSEPFPETPELEPSAPAPTDLDEAVEEESEDLETEEIEAIEDDNLIQPSDPRGATPDYLNPDANPLSFPTTPEEVELVGTQPLTLEQAIELGIRNSADLQAVRLELEQQRAALREAEAANYPTVSAGVESEYGASESVNPVRENPLDPNSDTRVETPVSRSLVLGGALTVEYSLYTSGRRSAAIQAAERRVRLQELQIESETEDLILQITRDYYDLQEADEEVQIFRASLEEAERSLRDAEALERAGVGTRFDVLQAQVDVANALQNLRNQESDQEIARRQLAERLNLNQTITLAAADPIEIAGEWELDLEETIVAAYRNRAELEQLLVQREIGERNRREALAALGPQVTVSTRYALTNTLATDPDSPQEDAGFLSNFTATLGVSVPLYDGGAARSRARQAEAAIAIAETNFANQRDQIRFQVEQAYSQLNSNFENIQTTDLAVQQAIEALRLARLRFQAGVGTQTDVLQAQTALTQARFNNLQAILNYNRALATLRRQVSNFPDGELNEVP